MKRFGFICSVVCLIVVRSEHATIRAADKPEQKPNILLILADDQRWDTIRALGNSEIHTPNLDKLVQRGFHFNNAYCMGGMTPAICLPSRTMLITGQSLWRIPANMSTTKTPVGVPLLPVQFNQAGYKTFHCGKSENACGFGNAAFATNIIVNHRVPETSRECSGHVIDFLQKHDVTHPFFVYFAPPVPHDPRVAPPEFVKLYDPSKLSLSKNFMPQHPFDNGDINRPNPRDERLASLPRLPEEMRQHLADYYAAISNLDHELGRIFETLTERGVFENTIIIFSSDQGLAVGGRHGLMGKQNLYEHVKPPLIVAGPGIPHGQSNALVYLFDLFPTLCEFAGIDVPAAVEGKSLVGAIQGKTPRVRDWLMGAYMDCQRMVRDERWKLIDYSVNGVRTSQLFDLANDPDELDNLALNPKHGEVLARLKKLLVEARREFADPVDFDVVHK